MRHKKLRIVGWLLIGVLCAGVLTAVSFRRGTTFPLAGGAMADEPSPASSSEEPIEPIPLSIALNPEKVALGKRLFHDPRLSRDNSVSCASCHDLQKGGTDRRSRSSGVGGTAGDVNAPTVFNSGLQFKQFWDGLAGTLEDQIDGPIHNPAEMGTDWPAIIGKISLDPGYRQSFARLYPDGMRAGNIKDSIAVFERSLITPNSRFDNFLRGDGQAITSEEKEGYRLFKQLGCVSCHQGTLLGGNMFETIGVMRDYIADRGGQTRADLGRFNVTGKESDRYKFKVPTLRNVAVTAPYFHDGFTRTLNDAVKLMAWYQLGREISSAEAALIVGFLHTLTGTYEGRPL